VDDFIDLDSVTAFQASETSLLTMMEVSSRSARFAFSTSVTSWSTVADLAISPLAGVALMLEFGTARPLKTISSLELPGVDGRETSSGFLLGSRTVRVAVIAGDDEETEIDGGVLRRIAILAEEAVEGEDWHIEGDQAWMLCECGAAGHDISPDKTRKLKMCSSPPEFQNWCCGFVLK
jgi:hypothetical protein